MLAYVYVVPAKAVAAMKQVIAIVAMVVISFFISPLSLDKKGERF
jgi:hypothetical protein